MLWKFIKHEWRYNRKEVMRYIEPLIVFLFIILGVGIATYLLKLLALVLPPFIIFIWGMGILGVILLCFAVYLGHQEFKEKRERYLKFKAEEESNDKDY